jgi:DNA-binding NtrC family response regulator
VTESATSHIPLTIQVLDDDPMTVAMLSRILASQGWEVLTANNIREATSHLSHASPDVAVVDVYLGEEDGLNYVELLKKNQPQIGIVVISADDTETLANKATKTGADYFLSKPVAPAALILTLKKLGELSQQRQKSLVLEQELKRSVHNAVYPEIITHSDSMEGVLRLIEKVSPRDLSVMIFGESGTGKELVARAIHQTSPRRSGPFIELNCAALPANLVESELFGHERGSFTGAIASRIGKIELADGGTLFLDEIGELPLEIQPKLLRALQEKRITRVGGRKDIVSDFRLVSATHRDLLKEVRESNFREDLFYRVAVFPIKLPPLRERMEDLDLLLAHFLHEEGIINPMIDHDARELLRHYQWPGNVRELKNFAQAITLLADEEIIDEKGVRAYFGSRLGEPINLRKTAGGSVSGDSSTYSIANRPVRKLDDIEREEILHALRVYKGNVPEAAMALGMGRATLYKYIKRNEIDLTVFGL